MKTNKRPPMKKIPSKKVVKDEYPAVELKNTEREIDPRPEFSVNAEALPAIKDWSVGKKYMIEMEVEMIGSRIQDWGDDKGKLVASFKINGIAADNDEAEESEFPEGMKVKK